jgi:hypothetical protein
LFSSRSFCRYFSSVLSVSPVLPFSHVFSRLVSLFRSRVLLRLIVLFSPSRSLAPSVVLSLPPSVFVRVPSLGINCSLFLPLGHAFWAAILSLDLRPIAAFL